MQIIESRRDFLPALSAAGAAAALWRPGSLADEAPPETTTIRLIKITGICIAPQYVAEELLRGRLHRGPLRRGEAGRIQAELIGSGEADFSLNFAAPLIVAMDAGEPIKVLAGVHPGCFELFANERVRSVLDLKGKRSACRAWARARTSSWPRSQPTSGSTRTRTSIGSSRPSVRPMELFAAGQDRRVPGLSARAAGAARARTSGTCSSTARSIAPGRSTSAACSRRMPRSSRSHPVATKRVLRAILKAADLCVSEPTRVARLMVDGGFAQPATTTRSRRWVMFPTLDGASTTRRTRCGSTRCACTRRA